MPTRVRFSGSCLNMSSCVDSLSLALGQISFAVNDLTKKNYKATIKEVHEVNITDYRDLSKFSFIPQLGAHIHCLFSSSETFITSTHTMKRLLESLCMVPSPQSK